MSAHLERLKAEEAELEAQMLGDQTVEDTVGPVDIAVSTTDDPTIEQTQEELEAADVIQEIIVQPPSADQGAEDLEESESQPQRPQRTNWKKRFIGMQKTHEAAVHTHKREMLEMQAVLDSLRETIFKMRTAKQEVQGDVFDGTFSQEEEDTFGTEGLDIVKKAARTAIEKQVKPLQEELRRQEEARIKESKTRTQAQREAAYGEFLGRLEGLVPEYAELNVDKGFLGWMAEPDPYSGAIRGDLFRRAEASQDVYRVADFFIQYKADAAKANQPRITEEMERHVTPTGSGASPTTTPTKAETTYLRESDINKFYDDVLKGRYAGKHDTVLATEAAIDKAMLENRILRGQ